MTKKIKFNKFKRYILCSLALLLSMLYLLPICKIANAESIVYTNVLEDLRQDSNFSLDDYPVNNYDYSLQLIQVSESINSELFVYIYQPCLANDDLLATSINISLTIDDEELGTELDYKNYKLTLLNSSGTLYKYVVKDLIISSDLIRYYEISTIFRKWKVSYDNGLPKHNDNSIDEVAFDVGLRYTFKTDTTGNVTHSATAIDLIEITSRYDSFYRFTNGSTLLPDAHDSFFTAFATDMPMDKLLEAQVEFVTYTYHKQKSNLPNQGTVDEQGYTYENGDDVRHNLVLSSDENQEITVGYIFKTTYTNAQIETVESFRTRENLSETTLTNLIGKQWVLNYYSAEYSTWADSVGVSVIAEHESGTKVKELTILRLKFRVDQTTYNLGVIDNKQTGSDSVGGETLTIWQKIGEFITSTVNILKDFMLSVWAVIKTIFTNWKLALATIGAIILIVLLKGR